MAVTISERSLSRPSTTDVEGGSVDLTYIVTGTEDDAVVRSTVAAALPVTYYGLVLQSYDVDPQGNGVWYATARYGTKEKKETGESSYSFDTGGGTTHLTNSLSTVAKYALPGETAPDFKGAIGVAGDRVEGVDVNTPVYTFSETHYIAVASVDGLYKAALFSLTGKVSDASFKGFGSGEVLFLGASGSQRGQDDWEITFRFAASENKTGITIGDIVGIDKKGWEYLWVRYADVEDENRLIKQPIAAYVEKVYYDGSFSGLGIGV